MLIHLMQHGACLPEELDPHLSLSPLGSEQAAKSGRAARWLRLHFDLIVTSPKLRAVQTAEIVAETMDYPVRDILVSDTAKANAPAEKTVNFLFEQEKKSSILLVGHLPSLGKVASRLMGRDCSLDIHIENGGLMQIEVTTPLSRARLNWHLTPRQLARLGEGGR